MEDTILENKRVCYSCGSDKTYVIKQRGYTYEKWYYNRDKDDNVICARCSRHLYYIGLAFREGRPYKPELIQKPCIKCGIMVNRSIRYLDRPIKSYGGIHCKQCQKFEYRSRRIEYFRNLDSEYKKTHRREDALRCKRRRMIVRDRLFLILGNKCIRCGFSDKRALQFDHINGGGRALRRAKKFKHGQQEINFYSSRPDLARQTLQVLCANCNFIKVVENNELSIIVNL